MVEQAEPVCAGIRVCASGVPTALCRTNVRRVLYGFHWWASDVLGQPGSSPETVLTRSIMCESKEVSPAKLTGQLQCAARKQSGKSTLSIGKTKGIFVLATRQRKTRKRPGNIPAPSPGGPSGAMPEIRPERALVVTRTDRQAQRSVVAPLPGAALETPPVGAVRSRGTRGHRLRGAGRRGGLRRKSPHCK